MDPQISVFDDSQEKVWSGFWQILYNLQMFGINPRDFTDRSDCEFQGLIREVRRRIDEPWDEDVLDEELSSLAELFTTGTELPSLRQGVAKYIESVPKKLGCFDMNLLYGPYMDNALPANLSQITKSHLTGCPRCANMVLKAEF